MLSTAPTQLATDTLFTNHPWLLQLSPEQSQALADGPADPKSWLWLLHDLTDPELLAAMADARLAGLHVPPEQFADLLKYKQMTHGLFCALGRFPVHAFNGSKTWERTLLETLAEMNEKYAVVPVGGKMQIVYQEWDESISRHVWRKMSFEEFAKMHNNQSLCIGTDKHGNPVGMPKGKWWLAHEFRRQFVSRVFLPGRKVPEGVQNLWAGWPFYPTFGTLHEMFLQHVEGIICSGNDEHYQYLIRWMARAVQLPHVPGEVAIVIRSTQEGTGKGVFAREFGKLFGTNYMQITNASHLVGNFNSHLQTCVMLFCDEAFHAKDKKHTSILKTLVTEPELPIEGKGVDVITAANCVHLIMASNDEHVIPAGEYARRFFVLDVDPLAVGDKAYFAEIVESMRHGGAADLLGYLQRMDLTGWNVRDVPHSDALDRQKQLTSEHGWHDVLGDMLQDHDAKVRSKCLFDVLGIPVERRGQKAMVDLGGVMRGLGFDNKPARFGGKSSNGYVRGDGATEYRAQDMMDEVGQWSGKLVPF